VTYPGAEDKTLTSVADLKVIRVGEIKVINLADKKGGKT
jgi:hypothetical protein